MTVVELTQQLVRSPGVSGCEEATADLVEKTMKRLGFRDITRTQSGSVVGLVGPLEERPALLFDGHMDVVPIAGDWSVDPFGGVITNGRLYGRGATDMKGGLAAALVAAATAAEAGHLRRSVAVSATVLEETVEGVALSEVLDLVDPEAVVICEPSSLQIQIGQRGRAELRLTAKGVPAHAAHPERGSNAVTSLAHALVALDRIAPRHDPELGAGILVVTDVTTTPYPSISMLPESATARFDRRMVTGDDARSVVAEMQQVVDQVAPGIFSVEIAGGEVICYTGRRLNPPRFLRSWTTAEDEALVLAAKSASEQALGTYQIGTYGFCTNGSESAGVRGIPTIGIGPGDEKDAHTADESVAVEQLESARDIYINLIQQIGIQ